jgi:predicted amidohydrolase
MKDIVDVALIQYVPRPLDLAGNLEAMAAAVREEAGRRPTDLVVFPELSTTGYVPPVFSADFKRRLTRESHTIPGQVTRVLGRAARETGTHVVAGTSELGETGQLYNSVVLISPQGEPIGVYRKAHLWDEECKYFEAGNRFDVIATDLGRIGLSICYDSRFPECSRYQALAGAEILVCVFAYALDPGDPADMLTHRAVTRAWENAAFYLAANRLGREAAGEFAGGSVVAGPLGEILARAHGERDTVIRARATSRSLVKARRGGRPYDERRPDAYGNLLPGGGLSISRSKTT